MIPFSGPQAFTKNIGKNVHCYISLVLAVIHCQGGLDMQYLTARYTKGKDAVSAYMAKQHSNNGYKNLMLAQGDIVEKQASLGKQALLGCNICLLLLQSSAKVCSFTNVWFMCWCWIHWLNFGSVLHSTSSGSQSWFWTAHYGLPVPQLSKCLMALCLHFFPLCVCTGFVFALRVYTLRLYLVSILLRCSISWRGAQLDSGGLWRECRLHRVCPSASKSL